MKISHGTENANIARPTVLTLGVFDGLHIGHQRIMETVVERANTIGAVPTAELGVSLAKMIYQKKLNDLPQLLRTLRVGISGCQRR